MGLTGKMWYEAWCRQYGLAALALNTKQPDTCSRCTVNCTLVEEAMIWLTNDSLWSFEDLRHANLWASLSKFP